MEQVAAYFIFWVFGTVLLGVLVGERGGKFWEAIGGALVLEGTVVIFIAIGFSLFWALCIVFGP